MFCSFSGAVCGKTLVQIQANRRWRVCLKLSVFFCQPLVLPPSVKDNLLDFGVRSATHTSSIIFVVVNSNPIEVRSSAFTHWKKMNHTEGTSDPLNTLNMLTCSYFFYTSLHCKTILKANTVTSVRIFDKAVYTKNTLFSSAGSSVRRLRKFGMVEGKELKIKVICFIVAWRQ